MIRRRFGRTEISVPVIGLGTFKVLDVKGAEETARHEVVRTAQRSDANLYDSSPMYGEAERVLGDAIREFREEAIVATKVWARHPLAIDKQIDRALEYYGGMIDIYQIHNLHEWESILAKLEKLKEEGKVKAIGITHYLESTFPQMMEIMETGRIDSIQIPYNVARNTKQQEMLDLAKALDLGVIVMEPLGSGDLMQVRPTEPDLAPFGDYGCTSWSQVLLKYVVSDTRVHAAIPATSSIAHMESNAVAGDEPILTEELRKLAEETYKRLSK